MNIIKTLIEYHKMIPHPEGGHYVEVFKNKHVSHIYFLLEEHEYSHQHQITKNEIGADNKFIFTIEKNTWFAMKSSGSYSLIGCTVAPAFEFKDLEFAPKNWKLSTLLGIVE